jgi:hypothetical protein
MRADRPKPIVVKTIRGTLSLICCLAASSLAAADQFTADKPSPLRLARAPDGEDAVVRFSGTVRIGGRFVVAWEGFDQKPRYLRVTFRPDNMAMGLLPHATGAAAVKELMLTNSEQAAAMLLGSEATGKILARTVLSAEGDATVTIGDYHTVVECDHRWYMARLVAVIASRDIVVATGESRRPGC